MSTPDPDPNPVFQSMIETARTFYKDMSQGQQREVQCCRDLLCQHEPEALERVREWAGKLGFPVREYPQSGPDQRGPGRINPPVLVSVTICKP